MYVYLTSAYEESETNFGPTWLRKNAKPSDSIILVDDPNTAEVILFVENHPSSDPYFFKVIFHHLRRKFPDKCVLYHDADRSVTCMRTISPSIEEWQFNPISKKPFHYIARLCENDTVNNYTPNFNSDRKYLASFTGTTRTHPLRNKLFQMGLTNVHLRDTGTLRAWEMSESAKIDYEQEYLNIMSNSYFTLCPRGVGPSTYRLYESMQAGIAPVIISDDFVPDPDLPWNEFAIFIKEDRLFELEHVLKSYAESAIKMGEIARKVWVDHCSPEVSLNRLVQKAVELNTHSYGYKSMLLDLGQFVSRDHYIGLLRYLYKHVTAVSKRETD